MIKKKLKNTKIRDTFTMNFQKNIRDKMFFHSPKWFMKLIYKYFYKLNSLKYYFHSKWKLSDKNKPNTIFLNSIIFEQDGKLKNGITSFEESEIKHLSSEEFLDFSVISMLKLDLKFKDFVKLFFTYFDFIPSEKITIFLEKYFNFETFSLEKNSFNENDFLTIPLMKEINNSIEILKSLKENLYPFLSKDEKEFIFEGCFEFYNFHSIKVKEDLENVVIKKEGFIQKSKMFLNKIFNFFKRNKKEKKIENVEENFLNNLPDEKEMNILDSPKNKEKNNKNSIFNRVELITFYQNKFFQKYKNKSKILITKEEYIFKNLLKHRCFLIFFHFYDFLLKYNFQNSKIKQFKNEVFKITSLMNGTIPFNKINSLKLKENEKLLNIFNLYKGVRFFSERELISLNLWTFYNKFKTFNFQFEKIEDFRVLNPSLFENIKFYNNTNIKRKNDFLFKVPKGYKIKENEDVVSKLEMKSFIFYIFFKFYVSLKIKDNFKVQMKGKRFWINFIGIFFCFTGLQFLKLGRFRSFLLRFIPCLILFIYFKTNNQLIINGINDLINGKIKFDFNDFILKEVFNFEKLTFISFTLYFSLFLVFKDLIYVLFKIEKNKYGMSLRKIKFKNFFKRR